MLQVVSKLIGVQFGLICVNSESIERNFQGLLDEANLHVIRASSNCASFHHPILTLLCLLIVG